MSYCRWGWDGSDVYVYADAGVGGFTCLNCHFSVAPETSFTCETPEQMIQHLIVHKKAGHVVPTCAITELWHEVEVGDAVKA